MSAAPLISGSTKAVASSVGHVGIGRLNGLWKRQTLLWAYGLVATSSPWALVNGLVAFGLEASQGHVRFGHWDRVIPKWNIH